MQGRWSPTGPKSVGGPRTFIPEWRGLPVDLTGDAELDRETRERRREYVGEWESLLRAARSELDSTTVQVLVRQALAVIDDLGRMPHVLSRPAFSIEVAATATAVLNAGPLDKK